MLVGKTARIVNTAVAGESENIAFQIISTNQVVQFSDIKMKSIDGNAEFLTEELSFSHPYIQDIYWNKGHECKIYVNNIGEAIIYLD